MRPAVPVRQKPNNCDRVKFDISPSRSSRRREESSIVDPRKKQKRYRWGWTVSTFASGEPYTLALLIGWTSALLIGWTSGLGERRASSARAPRATATGYGLLSSGKLWGRHANLDCPTESNGPAITPGWHALVRVWTGRELRQYVNGSRTDTTVVTATGSWTIYRLGWQFSGIQGLDQAYVPFFGAFGTAWDDALVARWSADPFGMLWPELDATFVSSGGNGGGPPAARRLVVIIAAGRANMHAAPPR
jgi:hypothetical protein